MRHLKTLASIVVILAIGISHVQSVKAAPFNPNRIIDDGVFDNYNSMSASQIDSFLNQFPNSCISPNSGFAAVDPTGYTPSSGYQYGGTVSAGQVIHDASATYGINPQVLLATLQKEQGTVTGAINFCNNGDQNKYVAALGFGCPDSGTTYSYTGLNLYQRNGVTITNTGSTCVNSAPKAGFSQQVIRAAWLLKFGEQRAVGNINWAVIKGGWDNSDDPQSCYGGSMAQGTFQRCPSGASAYYDGLTTIDATSVHIDNGATAALYWYTPHFHGNQVFSDTFASWFGSLYGYYHASYNSQGPQPPVKQGQGLTVSLSYKNDGTATWYDSSEAQSRSQTPVVLATLGPINRASSFSDTSWYSPSRPTGLFSKVYEANGTTLASDQHSALPGQIIEYDIKISVSNNMNIGAYREYFGPIHESSPSWFMGADNVFVYADVQNAYTAQYVAQSAYPTIHPNDSSAAFFKFKNNGTATWHDSTSAPSYNDYPIVLATDGPINRSSRISNGWYAQSRPTGNFSKVYESDGVTLALDQHSAAPGQVVEYDFPLTVPLSLSPSIYREYFRVIREGSPEWRIDNASTYLDVTVANGSINAGYVSQTTYPTIQRGGTATINERLANTGNTPWYDSTSTVSGILPIHFATTGPINRLSAFASSTWSSANRPVTNFSKVYEADGLTLSANQHIVQPGQLVDFSFSLASGSTAGSFKEYYQPIIEGAAGYSWNIGGTVWTQVVIQ